MVDPSDGVETLVHGHGIGRSSTKDSLRTWLQLIKCSKRIEQEMSARFRENYSSSLSRFDVLAHLYQAGKQGLSTTQLARRLLASKGNITRLLDRMEEDELIRRRPNPTDRRISDIFLSRRGAESFAAMAAEHERWSDEIFGDLDEGEKALLADLLTRLRQRVERTTAAKSKRPDLS